MRPGDTLTIASDGLINTRTIHSVVAEANGSTTIYDTQADAWYPDHPDYTLTITPKDG